MLEKFTFTYRVKKHTSWKIGQHRKCYVITFQRRHDSLSADAGGCELSLEDQEKYGNKYDGLFLVD